MNTTTKVFIVLNLLAALGFCYVQMVQYALDEHWKRRWNEDTERQQVIITRHATQTANESLRRRSAESDANIARAETRTFQNRIQELTVQLNERTREIAAQTSEISQLRASSNAKDQTIQNLNERIEQAQQRSDELLYIAQVARAVAFELNVKLAEVEDDFNNSRTENHRQAVRINDLREDLDRAQARLAVIRRDYPNAWTGSEGDDGSRAVGILRARVAAVRENPQGEQDLVMITVGQEENVVQGMEFVIFRDGTYICRVRAERVLADMTACRVIPDSWNPRRLSIEIGDNAQNRLY